MAKAALSKVKEKAIPEDHPVALPVYSAPDPQEIARLAYSYWEARGRKDGSADEDWLQAERELASRQAALSGRPSPQSEVSAGQAFATRAGGRLQ